MHSGRPGEHLARRMVKSDAAEIDRGVCASWCELLFRGPSASISRNGLRTRGVASLAFKGSRSNCSGHVLRGGRRCKRYRRQEL